ncbi:MAG: oxygenase MpaB family protein [Pseudomonadota bacterium]|mgnify:CR=1 FL=1
MTHAAHLNTAAAAPLAISVGPDSLTWRFIGDVRFLVFGLSQAFIVQVAHPVVSQGVEEFSTFRTDPYGRFMRSIALLWPATYNTPAGQADYGRRVRERHRGIKGVDSSGKAWHALNPEPYLWVHMTAFHAMTRFADCVGESLTQAEQEQLFQEWLVIGQTLGIRMEDLPATQAEFWAKFDHLIRHRLERTVTMDFLLSDSYFKPVRKGAMRRIPRPIWQLLARNVSQFANFTMRGTLPESFREQFDVPWSKADARKLHWLNKAIQVAWLAVPEQKRWLPEAWVAMQDARLHPERYANSSTRSSDHEASTCPA